MSEDRDFAVQVVRKLRGAGYQALWAGGCVRDMLMSRAPKDYDVATSALPDDVRAVFGRRLTIPVGASFGVITVVDARTRSTIEVATFRQDAEYSDGRHPDAVQFSTPQEDAQRRDFTINGMFYDPLDERVIDYVGGEEDLNRRRIRAIGDPAERISEDKLRMLRAVRFAATLDFKLEPQTLAAVQLHAAEIEVVSVERIATELRRMLTHERRDQALSLLAESRLLAVVLPESKSTLLADPAAFETTRDMLAAVRSPDFAVSLAALLRGVCSADVDGPSDVFAETICRRWKLTNDETRAARFFLKHELAIREAPERPWHQIQRILIQTLANELLDYCHSVAAVIDRDLSAVEWCRAKMRLPVAELNPQPLLDGNTLKALDISPGPAFKRIIDAVRDAQLEGEITTREEAVELATRISQRQSGT